MTVIIAIIAFVVGIFVPAPYDSITKTTVKRMFEYVVAKVKLFSEKE